MHDKRCIKLSATTSRVYIYIVSKFDPLPAGEISDKGRSLILSKKKNPQAREVEQFYLIPNVTKEQYSLGVLLRSQTFFLFC